MPQTDVPFPWKVRAGLAALLIPPLIHLVPLHRLAGWLGRPGTGPRSRPGVGDAARGAQWVDAVLSRLPWPWRRTCLTRSVVLYHLFRREGVPVELRIGVRRNPAGQLAAHAWLTHQGHLYLEPAAGSASPSNDAPPDDFSLIARFPDPPPGTS